MKCEVLFEQGDHVWTYFGQDPERPAGVIDTNQVVISTSGSAMLVDPGGVEIFPAMLPQVLKRYAPGTIKHLFLSHQDPDIASAMGLWHGVLGDHLKVYISSLWASFVTHFDATVPLVKIPDEGMEIRLSSTLSVRAIPAHYLHSSGNFHLYDPVAKILFTGDVGAAIFPRDRTPSDIYVRDFGAHTHHMEQFHRRWMGSDLAKKRWVKRVRKLDIQMMVPQHGCVFRGDDVKRFIDWFDRLDIASGANAIERDDS